MASKMVMATDDILVAKFRQNFVLQYIFISKSGHTSKTFSKVETGEGTPRPRPNRVK